MDRKIFGTDGIRGIVGKDLTANLAMKIGQAVAIVLKEQSDEKHEILIGRDTRLSGKMLEAALVAGITSVGVNCCLIEIVPTPAISALVSKYHCSAGIMISASHNPPEFNGIKIFNKDGLKFSIDLEKKLEQIINSNDDLIKQESKNKIGTFRFENSAAADYVDMICSTVKNNFSKIKVAVDCANGSACVTAAKIFNKLKKCKDLYDVF